MNALRRAVDRARGLFLLGRGMLRLTARGNAACNVEGAFDVADSALHLGWDKLSLERLRSDPDTSTLMRRRYGVVFAFLAGNAVDYGCLLISVTAAASHLLLRPHRLALDISVFSHAFLCGQRARSVLGVEFEELLEQSIFELREYIGIPRYGLGVVDCAQRFGAFSFRELDEAPRPRVKRNALTLAEASTTQCSRPTGARGRPSMVDRP